MPKKTNFGEYSIEQIIKPYLVTPSNKRWYIPCPKCKGKFYLKHFTTEPVFEIGLHCHSCGNYGIQKGTLDQMIKFFDWQIEMESDQ